jgi:glyoxylase-like metal-dependent hydrolase (beta-lactamase superfamily II)
MSLDTSLEHLHAIELPTPFPVGPITVYLAAAPGEPLTLVDTGPRTPEAWGALEAGLSDLGFAMSDLERIVTTHAHADHVGLAADIVSASDAQVLTHAWNVAVLGDYAADRQQRDAFFARLLRQASVPPAIIESIRLVTRSMVRFVRSVDVDLALNEGDTLRLAGRDWQVLHTPGHAAGLICLYDPTSRTLLSSDHLLADISSNPLVEPPPPGQVERPRSLALYISSLERVASMDIVQALPSHGPVVRDVAGLVCQRLEFHRWRMARVLETLGDGARTTWEVTHAIFPDRSPLDTFLAISEVIGHLDLLEIEGKIRGIECLGAGELGGRELDAGEIGGRELDSGEIGVTCWELSGA